MLSPIAKIMLTLSALAPVALIYSYVAWTQNQLPIALWALFLALLSVALCLLTLHLAKEKVDQSDYKATHAEAADGENIGFLLLYVLPLFTDQIVTLNWQLWLPTLALLCLLIGTGYAHHFNPLLGIFGWHFYKVSGEDGIVFILITKKPIASVTKQLRVGQLTDNILYDLGGKL